MNSSAVSSISGWHNLRSPALVLVHGGEHSADCWDLTVDELRRLAAELPVLAVDMPGHGATPGIVAKLGSSRVREMILAASCLPEQGEAIVDRLVGPLAWYVRRTVRLRKSPATTPNMLSALIFCNGMAREQRRFTMSRMHAEAATIITEPVDRNDLPDDVRRTWILTLRDHALSGAHSYAASPHSAGCRR